MVTAAKPDEALSRALTLVSNHPAVSHVGVPTPDAASGATDIDITFNISLPNEWRRSGESPTGVRLRESVRFSFPVDFPSRPPTLSLRADFNRDLPHMQPWLIDGCPVPCIYDGDLAELLHKESLAGILNQTVIWLERAALGTLIDPEQGWEPVRRDSFNNFIVADAGYIQGLANRNGGYRFLTFAYLRAHGSDYVYGQVASGAVKLNHKNVAEFFGEMEMNSDGLLCRGKSLALVVWPGRHPSGEQIICDTYLPETVDNVDSLRERAEFYGCANELGAGLKWLDKCLSGHRNAGPFTMAVILLARRPVKVIGSEISIELCPYVTSVRVPHLFAEGGETTVRPAAHHHVVSRTLLARMTGSTFTTGRPQWTLIGAGSLGSKLALHLARAGNGPAVVVDKSVMAPHNAARHALIPATGDMQILWMNAKAWLLSEALRGLDQGAMPIMQDLVSVLASTDTARRAWSKRSWAVVNATASLGVREAFAGSEQMPARVIETSLFAGGAVGVITVEGPKRNPNTADLMAEFYALLCEDPELASVVFTNDASMARQATGQGCGSLTMAMSDGRLSLLAAGTAEYLLAKQRDGLPDDAGEILIGKLSKDGLGLTWRSCRIDPTIVIGAINGEPWRVHVHKRAVVKMQEEASRWPSVETGGVLIGRLSETTRVAHVVDVLEAPEDSLRSGGEFVLGRKRLKPQLEGYTKSLDYSLYCLGTWHSHLCPGGPSETDRDMARAVSVARLMPSIFLILTPKGFHAFAAGMDGE